jgi:hypothetical protein
VPVEGLAQLGPIAVWRAADELLRYFSAVDRAIPQEQLRNSFIQSSSQNIGFSNSKFSHCAVI